MTTTTNEQPTVITFEEMKQYITSKYKHDRLYGRTAKTGWSDDYGDNIVQNYVNNMQRFEHGIISRHESSTGQIIRFEASDVKAFITNQ
ncbi:MAG: hypothetical protein HAW67_05340 [Endozoicomonadaceae bacterium]|nr:hypothetical protein [Endozoicomonadaceae bacterium]